MHCAGLVGGPAPGRKFKVTGEAGRRGGGEGGGGAGDPETRGTSCAIPSWNVPKSIFGSRSRRLIKLIKQHFSL